MFRKIRLMYWKYRDRGQEVRFMIAAVAVCLCLIVGIAVGSCKVLGVSISISTGKNFSTDVIKSHPTDNEPMDNLDTDLADPTPLPKPTFSSSPTSPASSTVTPTEIGYAYLSPTPSVDSSSVDNSSVDTSSLEQLLSFMNESSYEKLRDDVVSIAVSRGCDTALLLSDYQDIGKTDFDIIKYVKIYSTQSNPNTTYESIYTPNEEAIHSSDRNIGANNSKSSSSTDASDTAGGTSMPTILACTISLNTGNVNVAISDQTEDSLEEAAIEKEKKRQSEETATKKTKKTKKATSNKGVKKSKKNSSKNKSKTKKSSSKKSKSTKSSQK